MVSTNRERLPDPVAPLGAAYVAAALKGHGHDVALLDLQTADDIEAAVREACLAFRPEVAGISIRNVDNVAFPVSVSYLPGQLETVRALKKYGPAIIVAGGSGFTLMPAELLTALGLDLGIVGEGERAFPELLKRISENRPVDDLPGLAFRYKGAVRVNPPVKLARLGGYPRPDRGLLDNAYYMREGGCGNLQTKRGCPFKCVYCCYPLVEGSRVRLRQPVDAADEFESAVKRHGLRHIFIVDNVFNYPPRHAKEFCRELIKRRVDAGWSCYVNPRFMDDELAGLMAGAGCQGVEFGADSADDGVLARLEKGFNVNHLINASRACRDAGLGFCHGLLLGSPGETLDTMRRTLDAVEEMGPRAVVAMLGVRVLPRTRLLRIAVEEGVLKGGRVGLEPVFYFSPGLDKDGALEYLAGYAKERANFIMPGTNLRMTEKIRRTLRAHGFMGPLWESLRVKR